MVEELKMKRKLFSAVWIPLTSSDLVVLSGIVYQGLPVNILASL